MSQYPIDASGAGDGMSRTHVFLRCIHPKLENVGTAQMKMGDKANDQNLWVGYLENRSGRSR
jgi:hypothetical protein